MQTNYSNINDTKKKKPDNEIIYAGFWVRATAFIIDSLIVFGCSMVLRLPLALIGFVLPEGFLTKGIIFQFTIQDILLYILEVAYFVIMTYNTGTTVGKRLLNLRIISCENHDKLSIIDVIYRESIGRFLSGLLMGMGYILAGIDKEKRALHDVLCDTRVIYTKKIKVYPVYQRPAVPYNMNHPVNMPVQQPVNRPQTLDNLQYQQVQPSQLMQQPQTTMQQPKTVIQQSHPSIQQTTEKKAEETKTDKIPDKGIS